MDLESLRQQIEITDQQLLECLVQRRELALEVAKSKATHKSHVRDTQREVELLTHLMEKGQKQGLDPHYLTRLFHIIIEDSVLTQQAWLQHSDGNKALKIAHLGMPGSYSHLTAQSYAHRRSCTLEGYSCDTFQDVIQSVEDGHTQLGVLPIENTSSGSINDVYDLLRHTHLHIIGESYLPVDHHLLVNPDGTMEAITEIYGHPQALTQCSSFLNQYKHIQRIPAASSAHAMKLVSKNGQHHVAALGPQSGGNLYGLHAIAHNLANQKENHTRFIVVSREPIHVPSQLPAKTSLIMATHNQPGSLVRALVILQTHGINMTKLESRPMPGNPWEELFYIDALVNTHDPLWHQVSQELSAMTRFVKVLGCYPDERVRATHAPFPTQERN